MMTNNKLVIRRLPPSMSEDEFLRQVSPLPDHDYFCFFEANPELGSYSFSRAYVNFLDTNATQNFKERFDNYIFLDRDGQEYPAVVEQSFYHKCPRNGPFHKGSIKSDKTSSTKVAYSKSKSDASETIARIEQDPDYIEFMERHRNPKRRNQQSPIEALETNLNELTKQPISAESAKKATKTVAPTTGHVGKKRGMRNNRRSKK